MNDERWQRMAELFHAAVAHSPARRAEFLAAACAGDDASLLADVERLVAAHERAGHFIEEPAVAGAASWSETEDASQIGRRVGPYRIEREIGRGGMGTVYLAERADGQYEQRVAIKLVKRGMDTDLVLQRFRAERQILASLDHPNITRLFDGGTTDDDRPYFVMEYIEGEPIDGFADARRLSVGARLRLFLQVCDAVAHAHRHLVVHRDIKPVNILVTAEGVPKLLDFGIAKVLAPGADEEATTAVTGFRLLTPEYASPEQVDGRRATVASDVYSLGVVLYELLTGRSPYRLNSHDPLEVAAAVRTIDPERPSTAVGGVGSDRARAQRERLEPDRAAATASANADTLRRRLRGDLDTIALMALRKEPARRYESVERMAEDIRRHLDGMPVRARPDSVRYRAGKYIRRNRAAFVAATAAALVALLLGGGFLAYGGARERGADRSATAAGVLAPRDRILVADFADHAGDPGLAAALTDAFQADLTESPFVQVLSSRQVRSSLVRMERSPNIALDDSLAREVALREGVKAFVTGSISRIAGRYTMTADLVSAQKGDLLAALRETAPDSTDVIGAMGRLSQRMRERMGEPLRSVRASPPLERVTTASLPALRNYTEGVRLIVAGNRDRGLQLLRTAVALDTGFASAYRFMGVTYGDMVENGRMTSALDHALANQARLPLYERYHLIASRAYNVLGDYDAATDAYRHILERYPSDVRALNNLAYVFGLRRDYTAAESLLVRAIAIDSTIPPVHLQLVVARINRGDFDAARRELDRVNQQFPGNRGAQLAEIYLPSARKDWASAERQARTRLAIAPDDSVDALDGYETLGGIVMTQGRLAEAERDLRRVLSLSAHLGRPGHHYSSALHLAWLQLSYHHAPDSARSTMQAALARFPLDTVEVGDRPYDELARFFAVAGDPGRARELVSQAERSSLVRLHGPRPNRRWTLGVIALAQRKTTEAVSQLEQAAATLDCGICPLPDLARAFEAAGQPDSAAAVYERYLTMPWEWRFETDGIELGHTMQRLGELYEQRGDTARAIRVYGQLLQLWRGADDELQPVLSDVRRRRARLR